MADETTESRREHLQMARQSLRAAVHHLHSATDNPPVGSYRAFPYPALRVLTADTDGAFTTLQALILQGWK